MDVREFPLLPINNLKDDDTFEQMQLEIGPAAIVPSLGPASPAPFPWPTFSLAKLKIFCSVTSCGWYLQFVLVRIASSLNLVERMRTDSPRPSPLKIFRLAMPQNKTSFISIFLKLTVYVDCIYENKYCPICQKGLWNTALMLTAKSGRGVHPIPPPQAELFTHTTVKGIKLATLKFQSRLGGQGANAKSCFFQPFP